MTIVSSDRFRELAGVACVVGVGDTDYRADYELARAKQGRDDNYGFATRALKVALADAQVELAEIDGIVAGTPLVYDRLCEVIGLDPRWGVETDINTGLQHAVLALHSGMASCVALVYGNAQRTMGAAYGGPAAEMAEAHMAYTYYAPYGFTSQGAIYALVAQRLFAEGLSDPDDLGLVAVAQRAHAAQNPRAIMRDPVDLDDYRQARYVTEPLRILDYCLVSDGGVALVLKRTEDVTGDDRGVVIEGLARADSNRGANSLRPRLVDLFRTPYRRIADTLFGDLAVDPASLDALQVYDSFSVHVLLALEGLGLSPRDELGSFLRSGALGPGGALPTNTSGGHLSESYMQGWNHQVEAVRQVRGDAGARQVPNAARVMYASGGAGVGVGLVYGRPA